MQFVELFGLPGCGKTFLIKQFKKDNNFIKNNIVFISFSKRSLDSFFFKSMIIFISLPSLLFSEEFKKLVIFFKDFYRPRKSSLISIRSLSIIFNSIFLISTVKFFKLFKKRKKIFIDQGFIQLLLTFLYEIDSDDKKLEIKIKKSWFLVFSSLNINHLVLYCKENIKNIKRRLYERGGDSILEKNDIDNNDINYMNKKLFSILNFLRKEDFKNNFFKFTEIQTEKYSIKDLLH